MSLQFVSLAEFKDFAANRAWRVVEATQRVKDMSPEEWAFTFLHPEPNEDDCRWCKAASTCPAMAKKVQETIGRSFEQIVEPPVEDTKLNLLPVWDTYALSKQMSAAGLIEDWIKAVRAEVERRLLAGTPVEGWGLELGREGARKWSDAEVAEEMLRKQFRLPIEKVYDLSLISPTTAEKLAKAKEPTIGKKQWEKLQKIVVRSPAKPSVKPAAQIKTPYVVGDQTPVDEFSTVVEDDLS